jgi:multidrug efflux system membrane fusion protein
MIIRYQHIESVLDKFLRLFSRKNIMRKFLSIFFPITISLTLLNACTEKPVSQAATKPVVSVVVAKLSAEPITSAEPGRLEAYRQAEVRARAAGIVTERLYKEGQLVKKGTPLFRIDPAPLKAAFNMTEGQLASAEASHVAAADKLKRYEELREVKAVSELEYAAALAEEGQTKAAVKSAEASKQSAKLQLDYASVTAPIAGRARRAMVTEGALVGLDSPTPLTIIEQLDPIYVNFSQPAAEVMRIRRDTLSGKLEGIAQENVNVRIVLADGTEYSKPGKLLFSDLAVDPKTDTVTMRAEFPNSEGELLPGAFVNVKMIRAMNKTAVLIPRDALIRSSDSASVMVVNGEGKVESVTVKTDVIRGANWLVTEGLSGGEKVIISNPAMMAVGTDVTAVDKSLASASAEQTQSLPSTITKK